MPDQPASSGRLVAIVGPSGAGKDTLIDYARNALDGRGDFLFVRRCITRPAESVGEDHDAMSEAEFHELDAVGGFAVTWSAHGLHYGIPASVRKHLMSGATAILNGSRKALGEIEAAFPELVTIGIEVRDEIRAERLAGRGRETSDEILSRLQRKVSSGRRQAFDFTVENNHTIEEAGQALVGILLQIATTESDREAVAG